MEGCEDICKVTSQCRKPGLVKRDAYAQPMNLCQRIDELLFTGFASLTRKELPERNGDI